MYWGLGVGGRTMFGTLYSTGSPSLLPPTVMPIASVGELYKLSAPYIGFWKCLKSFFRKKKWKKDFEKQTYLSWKCCYWTCASIHFCQCNPIRVLHWSFIVSSEFSSVIINRWRCAVASSSNNTTNAEHNRAQQNTSSNTSNNWNQQIVFSRVLVAIWTQSTSG